MSSASNVLSGTDEAVGRIIVATLAWGAAREALGHAAEFADTHPSELSSSRVNAASAEVVRTSDVVNSALAVVGFGPFLTDDDWFCHG